MHEAVLVAVMLEAPRTGKLLVYASDAVSHKRQLKFVSDAARKMATVLKLNFEVVILREKFMPIYVYYKNGDDEPVPIYCSNNEGFNINEVYASLRNMMFVLSFHPKHSVLRQIRKEIMKFS